MSSPKTAFISGHTDLPQDVFEQHYVPLLSHAAAAGDRFILGDATGVDAQALDFLLSSDMVARHPDLPGRITVYNSNMNNMSRYRKRGVNVLSPKDESLAPDERTERLVEVKDKGKDRFRFRHVVKDAHMTLNSDYDILWARSEEEAREFYGSKYRPRVSATEMNRQRRDKLRMQREGEAQESET